MRHYRRWIRNAIGEWIGVQGDMQIWWPPEMPIVYVSNPKAGCSTIKHSLKAAQADDYGRCGRAFERTNDPHVGDDCLRKDGLPPRACRQRYVISCVRNPYTRTLSGFLDKVNDPDTAVLPEFGYRRVNNFEAYLHALTKCEPRDTNAHFRAQHINLDYPKIAYDAIFYLENLAPLTRFLSQVCPDFKLETKAPHARGASSKLTEHYTPRAIELVQEIYAGDFELFGYSRDLAEVGAAPGEMITASGLVSTQTAQSLPQEPRHAMPGMAFEKALLFRRLVDMRLI
jgi:hypothetical protein